MDLFWEKEGWEQRDRHLVKLAQMPFRRPFPFIPNFKLPGLYIIRGPRQIGKSSWLKEILRASSTEKNSSFYLSCENVADHKELAEILKSIRGRKVVLLDEVNFIPHWDRAIKYEIDSGHSHIIVLTGSHAHDLKQGADRMPGRFDEGGEFHLLPMDFHEFQQMRKMAGWERATRLEDLQDYFNIGGFPMALLESGAKAARPVKSLDTYKRWLFGDIVRLGKQEVYLTELLIQLALCQQTPLSLQTLSKKTSIGSHNTVQDYLSILESCFALKILYEIDIDTGAYRFRKNKKFYFTDPLIYWLSMDLLKRTTKNDQENAQAKLAEMTAHEMLSRRYPHFGYWQNTKGEEVDFYFPQEWAIEVKWAPVASNLSNAYKKVNALEKIVWTQNNIFEEWPR